MTTKQKQNIARFKAVQVEAKKLKAKNKNLSHTEAVKQAWAKFKKSRKSIKGDQLDLFSSAPKKAAKKSKTKRAPGYQYGKSNLERDQQRQALPPGKRKSASGRTYYEYRENRSDAGKLLGTKTHKDTKSHNVNIRVVSGAENYNDPIYLYDPIYLLEEINYWQNELDELRAEYKSPQRKMYKTSIMQDIRLAKKWLDNNKLKLKKVLSKIK